MHAVDPPPGYLSSAEVWTSLRDETPVFVRPVVPADVSRMEHAFAVADTQTLHRRFFTTAPPSDPSHLEYLATVDFTSRLALLCMDQDGDSIGIGRYEAIGPTEAEVAITVAPDWRQQGVGSLLLRLLEPYAAANGFTCLLALYLPSNRPVELLLQSLGYESKHVEDGVCQLSKAIG